MSPVRDYLDCAEAIGSLIASTQVASAWHRPSALDQWTVAGLAGHTARSVFLVPGILAADVDPGLPTASAVDYFVGALSNTDLDVDSEMSQHIRERGLEESRTGHADLAARYRDELADLAGVLATIDPERDVSAWGMRLSLSQYLVTRMVELAIHGDDLAVSVGVAPPALPATAEATVVQTLAAIAGRRRGFTAVMRGLARRERVTGPITAF
jgi:hypothetical protein